MGVFTQSPLTEDSVLAGGGLHHQSSRISGKLKKPTPCMPSESQQDAIDGLNWHPAKSVRKPPQPVSFTGVEQSHRTVLANATGLPKDNRFLGADKRILEGCADPAFGSKSPALGTPNLKRPAEHVNAQIRGDMRQIGYPAQLVPIK